MKRDLNTEEREALEWIRKEYNRFEYISGRLSKIVAIFWDMYLTANDCCGPFDDLEPMDALLNRAEQVLPTLNDYEEQLLLEHIKDRNTLYPHIFKTLKE